MQDYHEFLSEIMITPEQLQTRIVELGEEINQSYAGKEVLLVCILRGGVMFLTDLMRCLTIPVQLDFMAVSSYSIGARRSSGQARITLDLQTDIAERNVLLVEDIVDSGYTLEAVLNLLGTRHPQSVKTCVLLDKAVRREVAVPIEFCGFVIPDKFVFGYGLDIDEYFRNLPFIGAVDPEKYRPQG
jgi:hypoxanthine phosphoribosyltransferase